MQQREEHLHPRILLARVRRKRGQIDRKTVLVGIATGLGMHDMADNVWREAFARKKREKKPKWGEVQKGGWGIP